MSEDSLEDKALALIKSRPGGILQSELWKDLGIDSRKCSRVIARLEADGKIKRTWETVKGTRTYRISYLPQKMEAPKKEVDFSHIIANEEVAPCIGCTYECEPDYCPDLGNWIELLARASAVEAHKEEIAAAAKAREPEEAEAEEEEEKAVAPKVKKAAKEKAPKAAIEEKPAKKAAPKIEARKAAPGKKPVKEAPAKPVPVKAKKGGKK